MSVMENGKSTVHTGPDDLNGLNMVLPRASTNGGLMTTEDTGTGKLKDPKDQDLNMKMDVGMESAVMNSRLGTNMGNDVTNSMSYLLEHPQSGQLINGRLMNEDCGSPVAVNLVNGQNAGTNQQILNGAGHIDPSFALPTDDTLDGASATTAAAAASVGSAPSQPQIQSTPSISTGGSTNFQVQIAQRLADIDQRILRMEMMVDNVCNKMDSHYQQQSIWKNDVQRMEDKLIDGLNEIKGTLTSLKRQGNTQADGGFAVDLINAISNVSSKHMRKNTSGFPGSNSQSTDLVQLMNGYNNMQLNSMGAPMSYVPGEQANLNQLGNSKDQIDRFLTKSANEFMLDPSGLKKRRKNPSNEPSITLSHSKSNNGNQTVNYSASLPNLNLDALSKAMLPPHQQLAQHVGAHHQYPDKNIKFGLSSTSHSSSNSSDSEDDDDEDDDGDDEEENEDENENEDKNNQRGDTLVSKTTEVTKSTDGNDVNNKQKTKTTTNNNQMNANDTTPNTNSQLDDAAMRSYSRKEHSEPNNGASASASASASAASNPAAGSASASASASTGKSKLYGDPKKEPKFTMIKAPSSVKEIWKEYTEGIDGRPSIKSLDQKFGNKWRANKNKKTYSRRKRMYKFILNGIKKGKSEEEMVQMLENKRLYKDSEGNQKKRTIGWLQQSLSGI